MDNRWIFLEKHLIKFCKLKKLGAKTVEMECSALAACAEFRNISFAQILFTADSLADMDNYDKRNWGHDSYSVSLNIGSQVLASL